MEMDWSNESYVRIYTRDTTAWKLWGFEAQTVFMHVSRKFDSAGVLDLEGCEPWELAVLHCGLPEPIARIGMARLLERGDFVSNGRQLCDPSYRPAQESTKSDRLRQREARERRRVSAMTPTTPEDRPDVTIRDESITNREEMSRAVTSRHEPSRAVTLTSSSSVTDSTTAAVAPPEPPAAAACEVVDIRGALRVDAARGHRWWVEVCGLPGWGCVGRFEEAFAELGRKPPSELSQAAAILRVEKDRPGMQRILKPMHVVGYWPDYSQGRRPGQRVELPAQESSGAARVRAMQERHAAEIAALRARGGDVSYELDIMRAEHLTQMNGVRAAVERDGAWRGGSPSSLGNSLAGRRFA